MTNVKVMTGALVVSLIANVYLLATRSSETSTSPGTNRSGSKLAERAGGIPTIARVAPGKVSSDPNATEPGAERPEQGAEGDPEARKREAALTAELLKIQAALEEHRPLNERFKQSAERSPEIEEQIKPALDRIFPSKPGEKSPYTVECHGSVCSLDVDDNLDVNTWMHALQTRTRDVVRSFNFGVAGTYLEVGSPDWVAGEHYVQSVFSVIRDSPVVAECKQRFPTPGTVVLRVALGADREVHVTMEGDLADKAFGACLRPLLDRAPSEVPPPPGSLQSLPEAVLIVSVPKSRPGQAPVQRRPETAHLASTATTFPK
jgi:hypothetical protein